MTKADRPELPKPSKPPEPVHYVGEPARLCRNCEHFDGGGLTLNGDQVNRDGDCHNSISGRFQTSIDETCVKGFYPCTTRFPLDKRYHGT
jgi:hypothetical protein